MAEAHTRTEELARVEGLTIDELEAQVADLLPDRLEMHRRRRRRGRRSVNNFVFIEDNFQPCGVNSSPLTCEGDVGGIFAE